jgi:hypothetical protein
LVIANGHSIPVFIETIYFFYIIAHFILSCYNAYLSNVGIEEEPYSGKYEVIVTYSKLDFYKWVHFFFQESISGSVRLTSEGTIYFHGLSRFDKDEFATQLLQEISFILPIDFDRLESDGPDTSSTSKQLIIPIKIKSTKGPTKRNAYNLHRDLNVMIEQKWFNEISKNQYALLLDQTYGYQTNGTAKLKFLNLFNCKIH